ncbi:BREX-1 system protein BrxB [Bacillus sp. Hm123]|uniref:BREX-1 system protein BrxB n=1 Tax=Bacillus sp. Hm123 TaxID=3450745 RepID=UPI003F43C91B
MRTIQDRLDEILPKVMNPSFRENKGLGNEIGFYIFDYHPKDEMLVREHISYMKERLSGDQSMTIREFDLYEIMLELLDSKGYLQKNIDMEQKKGSEFILNATRKALRLTSTNDLVVKYIIERVQPNDIVFLTGVGKAFPIIRSHTILNNLHKAIEDVPLVMFFPGTYDGLELVLFGEIKDDNYYRAFQLIDK